MGDDAGQTSLGVSQPPSADAAGAPPGNRSGPSLALGVARSGLWAAGGQAATLLATLFATPFTIRLLGPVRYGLWSLLRTVLIYFQLADLGMATASTRFAAERYAHRDAMGESTVIWTALAVTVALTGAAAIAASLAAPFVISVVLHVKGELQSRGVLAFRLVCVTAVLIAISNTVNTPQQVRLRWRSVTLAMSGPTVLQIAAAPVVLAAVGGGVVTMTAVTAIAFTAAAALNLLVAVRLQPALTRPHVTRTALRPMVRYGGALAISSFADIPLMTAERFWLAHFRSPRAVAYYAAAGALGSLLTVFALIVSQPLLPALTRLASEERTDEHRRLYHQVLRGLFLLTTPSALVLAFLARPFFGLWAGPAYGVRSTGAFYVILIGLWFNTLASVPMSQLLAAGRTSAFAVLHVAELIPYLILAAALTSAFGVVGAAAAWSIRMVFDSVAFFVLVGRRYQLPWLPTPRHGKASLTAFLCLAGVLFGLSAVTSSLAARVAWSLISVGVFGTATWKLVLSASERSGLATLLGGIVPHRTTH